MYQRVTMNMGGARKRYETLEGKQYLVVPTVALTPGVHTGTSGPLLYLPEELSKSPGVWNHKPTTVHHPVLNGDGISACDPSVVESQRVGLIFNASYDGRLRWETWIDEEKLARLSKTVKDRLDRNETVEVSTGLYHDLEAVEGTWNGEKYVGIVRNIQPDHLAILPDQKGACSIADGAGLLRNADGSVLSYDDIRTQMRSLLRPSPGITSPLSECGGDGYCYVCDVYPKFVIVESNEKTFKVNYKIKKSKVAIDGAPEEVTRVTTYVTNNNQVLMNEDQQGPIKAVPRPAASDLAPTLCHQQAQSALQKKYSGIQQEGDWGGWVTELASDYVIYYKDGKHFRLPYTYDDDKIDFGVESEVERVSQYRPKDVPIDGTMSPPVLNQETKPVATPNTAPAPAATTNAISTVAGLGKSGGREAAVNGMISGGYAKESDRESLMGLPDDGFESVKGWVMRGATQPVVVYSQEGIKDRSSVHNASQQMLTANQYIEQAPPEIRDMLQMGLQAANARKQHLIKVITNNANNRFHPDYLSGQGLPFLEGIASLAHQAPHQGGQHLNYSGRGEPPMFITANAGDQPTNNGQAEEYETLPLPAMSFEKQSS